MRCAICYRQARGFGWFNASLLRSHPRRYSDQWVFCSLRCLNSFSTIMKKTDGLMIDASDLERQAMRACLAPLGEYVGSIGMERSLADYSREEVLMLIEVVVTAYQEHMIDEHERMAEKKRAYFEERLDRQGQATSTGVPR